MPHLRDLIKTPTAAELALIAAYGAFPKDAARERAFLAFAESGLPHRRMEAFKWTDFKAGLKHLNPGSAAHADPFEGLDGTVLRIGTSGIIGLDALPASIRVIEKTDGHAFTGAEDVPLGAMTAALTQKTILFDVTETVEMPLRLVYAGDGEALFSRLIFMVREGASLSVIESHLGGAGLNAALTEYTLKAGARVRRTLIQPPVPEAATAIVSQIALDEGAVFTQTALAFGGKVTRIETRAVHQATGAELDLNAAYLAGKGQHIDFTSHVRHGAPEGKTVQRTKGAVLDGGTGVFQGKFHVPRHIGQRTDADMQHNALLLEDGAVVNAKPELEIYADDVECAHGNTCGALDAEALFYMRQRGIPEPAARALLTEAFIADALETADEAARDILLETARLWLAEV